MLTLKPSEVWEFKDSERKVLASGTAPKAYTCPVEEGVEDEVSEPTYTFP